MMMYAKANAMSGGRRIPVRTLKCLIFFALEIEKALNAERLEQRFQQYRQDQPIFENTNLFQHVRNWQNVSRRHDLIEMQALTQVDDTDIFHAHGHFYKLDTYLNPIVVSWSMEHFAGRNMFVHLDPFQIYASCPPQTINEYAVRPANPDFYIDLQLNRNNRDSATYELDPDENNVALWEYGLRGIRRLEIGVVRGSSGNLRMSLEELSDIAYDSQMTIGRHIHLDSDDPMGTPFETASVNHLDLAINVYCRDAAQHRYEGTLSTDLTVESATFRTHLFRIESIPLDTLFVYASMFFRSQSLLAEWFANIRRQA